MKGKNGNDIKVAVAHNHLGFRGGGERTVLILAANLGLDFITAYSSPDTFRELQDKIGTGFHPLAKQVIKLRGVRFFWLRFLFWKNRSMFKNYDVLVASDQAATEAVAKHARRGATKMVYTHTPPRRVFDRYEATKKMYPWFLRPAYVVFSQYWKWMYLSVIRKYDFNVANSNNVRNRIKKYTGGDASAVVWPPIETSRFKWIEQEDYFLSWGRVDEAKRIELIARAFKKMPELKLKIASGGPYFDRVKAIAEDAPNIEMVGWVEENQLYDLVGKCRAAIYIPIDEDAGMTHIEANAAGKPVLGVKEGGLIESIIDEETGVLIPANPTEEDVISAARKMTKEWCMSRKETCENYAKDYDTSVFLAKMKKFIEDNDPSIPIVGIDASRWEDPRFPGKGVGTGVQVYSKNVIRELVTLIKEKGLRVRIYTPRTIEDLPLEIQKVIPGKKYWTKKCLARELKYSPVDYFYTPGYYIPKNAPENSFATIHDVLYKTNKSSYSLMERAKLGYATRTNIKKSKYIITISNHSKQEIQRVYGVRDDKTILVPIGYDRDEKIVLPDERQKRFFYVGRIEKRKSVDVLVKAFAKIKEQLPEWELILAGGDGHGADEIKSLIKKMGLEKNVKVPGYVDETTKWDLLKNSSVFVHPSSQEGSCIPLFEAWNAEVPAIVSDADVIKEVGKDAVSYFKSNNVDDLSEKMLQLANDVDMRKELIQKGKEELGKNSWKNTANGILNIILK